MYEWMILFSLGCIAYENSVVYIKNFGINTYYSSKQALRFEVLVSSDFPIEILWDFFILIASDIWLRSIFEDCNTII
jgi:hypothetical protein